MPHLCRCVTVTLPFKSFARVGARARVYRLTIYQLVTIIMIIIATIIITITVTVASSRVVSSD